MRGRLALVGSGEYLPVMHDTEAWLLEDRPRVYVQLATAASTEGEATIRHWHELGAQAAARLDAQQVIVDVRTRADADEQPRQHPQELALAHSLLPLIAAAMTPATAERMTQNTV